MEEEYKKKYEDALDRAKDCHVKKHFNEVDDTLQDICEYIFPELKESEDERIRKKIIDIVKAAPFDEEKDVLLDWLEKQKEQKPAEWSEKYIADVFEKVGLAKIVREQGNDELTNAVQSAMLELSKGYKQEWSEEDQKMLNKVLDSITYAFYEQGNEGEIEDDPAFLWLHRLHPQPKQEWSEKDNYKLDSLIRYFEGKDAIRCTELRNYIDWLKSLRPQPKRDGGDDYNKGYIKGRADTLKEFNDMPSWKPSEEQMRALQVVLDEHWDVDGDALYSLYTDLKKLM